MPQFTLGQMLPDAAPCLPECWAAPLLRPAAIYLPTPFGPAFACDIAGLELVLPCLELGAPWNERLESFHTDLELGTDLFRSDIAERR